MCWAFPTSSGARWNVRARTINEEMKVAAAQALAELAREDVPDEVAARLSRGAAPHSARNTSSLPRSTRA